MHSIKHYMIYSFKKGSLFCLTVETKDNKDWYLTEWTNMQKLDAESLHDSILETVSDLLKKQRKNNTKVSVKRIKGLIDSKKLEKDAYWQNIAPVKSSIQGWYPIKFGKKSAKVDIKLLEDKLDEIIKKGHIDSSKDLKPIMKSLHEAMLLLLVNEKKKAAKKIVKDILDPNNKPEVPKVDIEDSATGVVQKK